MRRSWYYLSTTVLHFLITQGRRGGEGVVETTGVYCVRMERTADARGSESKKGGSGGLGTEGNYKWARREDRAMLQTHLY